MKGVRARLAKGDLPVFTSCVVRNLVLTVLTDNTRADLIDIARANLVEVLRVLHLPPTITRPHQTRHGREMLGPICDQRSSGMTRENCSGQRFAKNEEDEGIH